MPGSCDRRQSAATRDEPRPASSASASKSTSPLAEYDRKRDFSRTPEPAGEVIGSGTDQLRFVIQKHAASRLHYDFRIELDGVLKSWAVPKGPSLNPADKRLAVQVEDHPLDYGSFEGVIPKGEYGGGQVIVWDRGTYQPEVKEAQARPDVTTAENILRRALDDGSLAIVLRGQKLRGGFQLVRTSKNPKDWLLIKHDDRFAEPGRDVSREESSVISNLTVEDIQAGRLPSRPAEPFSEWQPARPAGARKAAANRSLAPMLPSPTERAFDHPDWLFEPKLDGVRALAELRSGRTRFFARSGLEPTEQFPALVRELTRQSERDLVLDGEIVALDDQGRPSFERLQKRLNLKRPSDISQADRDVPVVYYVFDLLYVGDQDLRRVPLVERKQLLRQLVEPTETIRLIDHFAEQGKAAYQAAVAHGLEGLVAKRRDSSYESGRRSGLWLKIKSTRTDDFVIGGFTAGSGNRRHSFGALLLGQYDEAGRLQYSGNVGTGFDDRKLADLKQRLAGLRANSSPFANLSALKDATWIKPVLVADVKFAEWTRDRRLRAPVFLHLRPDKPPTEAVAEAIRQAPVDDRSADEAGRAACDAAIETVLERLRSASKKLTLEMDGYEIAFTSLDRELWPAYGRQKAITKRDYAAYLARVSPYLLPHLRDRPLSSIRYPGGIQGEKFFQKHWSPIPEFVETVRLFSEHGGGDQDYVLCNNLPTLLWLAQFASLELHTWYSRTNPEPDGHALPATFAGSSDNINQSLLNYPDFIVFDLDPYLYSGREAKGAEPELHRKAFRKTCEIALRLKGVLDSLSLSSFVKTSGRTGLHIFSPVSRQLDYDAVRSASATICQFVQQQCPQDVTVEWTVQKRAGKVFLDYNQNVRGKTVASIYSPRASPEGTVSAAVSWSELATVYPTDFTIASLPRRLERVGDLWSGILDAKRDLRGLLA